MAKHEIRPHRTSGVQPHVSAAVPPVDAPTRRAPIENTMTLAQRRTVAQHWAELIEPTVRGTAVTVRLEGAEHGLPGGVQLAPGDGVLYLQYRGSIYALVESGGRIMQLNPDPELASRIRLVHFTKQR